jgi:hypothetical protein
VCGPPRAGKSTFIQTHKDAEDFVIDWDNIAFAVAGVPMHQLRKDRIPQIVFYRNQLLGKLPELKQGTVYIEEGGPERWKRQHWVQSLGGRVVVLETPADICGARVVADGTRTGHGGPDVRPEAWWERYTVDYTDERIR